jgi:PKHD-type hydroxylase
MDRTRGAFIAFPNFLLHRVTPVTRGTRWSLVAWIMGPRWS